VTFDVFRPNGRTLLSNIVGSLKNEELIRGDVPVLLSREERRAYTARVRSAIMRQLSDEVFEAYYEAERLRGAERQVRLSARDPQRV
jgi:hypothetical protein